MCPHHDIHVPRPDKRARHAWPFTFAWALVSWLAHAPLAAADLSMLSDFGRPDITLQRMGIVASVGNLVGVEQEGDVNTVSVQQSGGGQNNVQVWQRGTELRFQAVQQGTDNELRLSQATVGNQGVLTQIGQGNQLAIQQTGAGSSVTGEQLGVDNALVLLQPGASDFSFLQQGNQNTIQAEIQTGQSIHVEQIGDQLSVQITPNN